MRVTKTAVPALGRLSSAPHGLTEEAARERLARHGPNVLERSRPDSGWRLWWRQIDSHPSGAHQVSQSIKKTNSLKSRKTQVQMAYLLMPRWFGFGGCLCDWWELSRYCFLWEVVRPLALSTLMLETVGRWFTSPWMWIRSR
ncbi:cation-transporting P-type ATPase [Corallococcus carmarthensis]|uniref:Cation-transporting P-type ATPase N-terminal domain-containing protein n=1 Tax=Corallococcus carmarthensis TaxID=2316728 RepID=A0A3A8K6M5_9BACT|nr:hypothetical protein D7X32_13005 [Corallococcus carmarthensis]